MTVKSRLGAWLIPQFPISRHTFDHLRLELNAGYVRLLHKLHPAYRWRRRKLRKLRGVRLNVGCGPFGEDDWINLDLYKLRGVTIRTDCRGNFPIANLACSGIHVEHYFEHLTHDEEAERFLLECHRCLQAGGVLRIIVPDAERFLRAYVAEGWTNMQQLAAEGTLVRSAFETKMQAINHVMIQGYEHFGGYDFETLALMLEKAGFIGVERCRFRHGAFPGGCIDREQHKPYSLYVEATRSTT